MRGVNAGVDHGDRRAGASEAGGPHLIALDEGDAVGQRRSDDRVIRHLDDICRRTLDGREAVGVELQHEIRHRVEAMNDIARAGAQVREHARRGGANLSPLRGQSHAGQPPFRNMCARSRFELQDDADSSVTRSPVAEGFRDKGPLGGTGRRRQTGREKDQNRAECCPGWCERFADHGALRALLNPAGEKRIMAPGRTAELHTEKFFVQGRESYDSVAD